MQKFLAAFMAGVVVTALAVMGLSGPAPEPSATDVAADVATSSDEPDVAPEPQPEPAVDHKQTATSPINSNADPSMDEQTLLEELASTTVQRQRNRIMERLGLVGTGESVPTLAELAEQGRVSDRPAAIAALGGIATKTAVDTLIALSDSGPAYQRRTAIMALGRAGGPTATQWLRELVTSAPANLAGSALSALADAAGEGAQQFLLTQLRSGERRLATAAAQALAQLGTPDALDALITVATRGTNRQLRGAAIRGLAGFDDSRARKLLHRLAVGNDAAASQAAVDALANVADAEAVKTLRKAALDGAPTVRSQATWGLTRIGDMLARDALIAVLAKGEQSTSWSAARGLADIWDEESIEALLKALQGPPHTAQAAVSALSNAPRDERIVKVLREMLEGGSNSNLMAYAAPALANMLGDEAVPLLEEALKNTPANQQYALISALGNIDSATARAALRRAVDSAAPAVQMQALQALARNGSMPKDELRELILAKVDKGVGYNIYSYADMLARMGDDKANKALIGMLGKTAPNMVHSVASAIINGGNPALVESLVDFTKTSDNKVQRQNLLNSMVNSQNPAARAYVLEVVKGDTKEADDLLRSMAWNRASDVKDIAVAGLESDRPTRRAAALTVLGRLNDSESIATVSKAMFDDDKDVRRAALSALQSNNSKAATSALIEAYPKLESQDQGTIVYALARSGNPKAIPMIKQTLEEGGDGKYSALHALISVGSNKVMDYLKGLAEQDGELGEFVAKQLKNQLGFHGKGLSHVVID